MFEEDKRIIIEQGDPERPIKITIEGSWRAKEITKIQRLLILAYRHKKADIRKQEKEDKEE